MAVVWPSNINTRILVDGFSEKMERNAIAFTPEVGPPKERRRTSISTDLVSWPQAFSRPEWELLKAFYRSTLKDGVLPFQRRNPLTSETLTYKFIEAPDISDVRGLYFFSTLKLRRMP